VSDINQTELLSLGCEVIGKSRSFLQVSVPTHRLLDVARVSGVRFVRPPIRPHASRKISQGTTLTSADDAHIRGVTGSGIRVGIIDSGFEGIRIAVREGDLPSKWHWRDYTGESVDGGGVHGTGVAEIIHDIAPDAELYYYRIDSVVDFENAADAALSGNLDIVNCSLQWFGTGFGDGTGVTCDVVDRLAEAGIIWVNSAGNQAQKVYNEFFQDLDDDGWHNVDGDGEVLRLLNVAVGDTIEV